MFDFRRNQRKLIFILFIYLLMIVSAQPVKADEGTSYVIANTKDWRSIYIAGTYAALTNSKLMYISNLYDAQLTSDKMSKINSRILVLESNNKYVVKNYESFLEKNGHSNLETVRFNGYSDLQTLIFNDIDTEGVFVLNPEYGSVAISAVPYILKHRYIPFFINSANKDDVKSLGKSDSTIIAGRIPAKVIEDLRGTKLVYSPFKSIEEVTELVLQENTEEWGLIVKADEIDPITLKSEFPVFIFVGEQHFDELVSLVDESGLTKFEVIGAPMNDIAKQLDVATVRDLKIMLKYGMFISTGEPGFQSEIQNLKTIRFDYPYEKLTVTSATYYSNINRLALTFKNEGNIDVMFFSTVDFLGNTVAEIEAHHILIGQTKTIPFEFSGDFDGKDAKMSTRYGVEFPLINPIRKEGETLYFTVPTQESSHFEEDNITLLRYGYDYKDDKLILDLENPNTNDIVIFAELKLDEEKIRTSKLSSISRNNRGRLEIETPYTGTDEIAHKVFNVTIYFGEIDTLNTKVFELEMKEYPMVDNLMYYIIIVIILVIIIFLILLIKRKKDKEEDKEKVKKKSKK
ncbi:MAG: hypothetical protein JSW73_02610 [Candidatus Woesearchaeota archaeon]|nr:MAG: hypothetical protein JSW73_02610 [Candidatus Woesearchaeota archaeon]